MDKRNLYLAREGFVRPGSDAAEGVSAADMNRRLKLVSLKKQKLKNTNFFISATRLSVHNLAPSCDEKRLKKIFLDAVVKNGVKGAKITECRIMRDGGRLSSSAAAKGAVGKSRGFGFVAFSLHEHALAALRLVNNNPDLVANSSSSNNNNNNNNSNKRRLIVEFAVESSKALQIQEKRWEKIKASREAKAEGGGCKGTAGGKGPAGGKRAAASTSASSAAAAITEGGQSQQRHSGFQAEKGKAIQGLPKRLGAKMRHRDKRTGGKGQK